MQRDNPNDDIQITCETMVEMSGVEGLKAYRLVRSCESGVGVGFCIIDLLLLLLKRMGFVI